MIGRNDVHDGLGTQFEPDTPRVLRAKTGVVPLGITLSVLRPLGQLEAPKNRVDTEWKCCSPQNGRSRLQAVLQLVRVNDHLVHQSRSHEVKVVRLPDPNDVM